MRVKIAWSQLYAAVLLWKLDYCPCARREEVDLQRRLNSHPNIVRFLGASCYFPPRALASPSEPDEAVQVLLLPAS